MATREEQMAMDLGGHFQNKVRVQLDDIAQAADAVDLDMTMFAMVLYTVLMAEAAVGAISTRCSEEQFVSLARDAWKLARAEAPRRFRRAQQ